ncbi:FecR family protein [Alcanivorax sp. IO_7]|nr:FecR family protein [Alcanivorax sp. IO_7]
MLGLGAAAFTVGALGYGGARQGLWRRQWADLATGVGETATHTLADGTRLVLNTDTALDVDFNDRGREIRLHRGEVLVTTGHGDARPFRVRTRDGAVRPLGTRFTVRRTDRDTRVAVYQGRCRCAPAARPGRCAWTPAMAPPSAPAGWAPPAARRGGAGLATGQLVAERMTVADFAGELARYRHGLVRYQPEVAGLRVTGVFSLTDTDRALDALARALPVRVRHYTPLWIRIEKKGYPD